MTWNIGVAAFILGGVSTIDLSTTLPSGVLKGGTFGVDPRGTPLPPGMSLSSTGVLFVGSANVGQTSGVIFTYREPGT